jgi:sugar/nucleoside kinase (ribokinase family)
MLGNLTPAIQQKVIEQLDTRPKFIALDTMNFWMDTAMESLLEVLKKIDCLIINDEEARQLSGEHSLVKAAIIYGSAMASFCVEKFSIDRLVGLSDEEIRDRVAQFVNLVNFDAKL